MKSAVLLWIEGILAVVFGVFIIVRPAAVLSIAVLVFSIILAFRGIMRLVDAIRFRKSAVQVVVDGKSIDLGIQKRIRETLLTDGIIAFVIGIASFIVGISAFRNGGVSLMKGVVYAVAVGFLITGIANLIESHSLKPYPALHSIYHSSSIAYIVAAVILFVFPFFVGQTFMTVFGVIVITAGIISFIWGCRVYAVSKKIRDAVDVTAGL